MGEPRKGSRPTRETRTVPRLPSVGRGYFSLAQAQGAPQRHVRSQPQRTPQVHRSSRVGRAQPHRVWAHSQSFVVFSVIFDVSSSPRDIAWSRANDAPRGPALHRSDAPPTGPVSTYARGVAGEDSTGAPRVVVVDDDPRVLRATAMFLESRGATVRAVSSAFDAVAAVEEHQPTVLVLDVSMPAIGGERLWGLFRGVTVKMPRVVFYSGLGDVELRQIGKVDPTVQRVQKGASPDDLWDAVVRAHEESPARTA